ncbi:MAG TPA: methyl-accepting chemotaxis protein [Bradyrhizobium sp.]|jgi:methyl-accepting chemotaxis protein|uniref:methyl-accepting chemotaxis protein n=1 Tax=Bradyrhizobium sp. TaxID=376 RepID=UPI002B47050F|nr:methyl-accepting chemotaxis protein [Bradyrhizobium sp.]HKO70396.1 methyl-accepting chemotaxis protein [Bradyrhizobium sp.]
MKTTISWYHFGLRGRLFTAFGVVAALTVLASSSAIISYDSLGRSLGAIAERSLPEITRASDVVRAAGEVAAAAPHVLAATDVAEREQAFKVLAAARKELTESIGSLASADAAKLNSTANRILANLDRLVQSVTERQTIAAARDALIATARKSHQQLAEKLAPLADDAGFTLTIGLQTAADKKNLEDVQKMLGALVDDELGALQAILEMRAESNLMLGILVEAADLKSADLLPPVKDRFTSAARHLGKAAAALKEAETSKLVDELVKTGRDAGNIFELKQRELVAAKTAANVVAENRMLAQEFEKEVASLGKGSQAAAARAVRDSEAEIQQGRVILISLALLSLGTALVVGWYYVGRGVVRRLVRLQNSMKSIAAGDLTADISTGGSDEIADMAEALQIFKSNMLESNRLRAERSEAEKQTRAQRRMEMQKLADEFEAAVGDIVQTVSSASTELEASASSLTKTAEDTQKLSGRVEAVSEEASSNVRSVAAAAEEMTASIAEISRQVQESNRIAAEAVSQAEATDARINELSKAALRIGDVVNLITTIAEQTNLLALNATIEAARAGDSGRGFAVVAQEVKALAAQTASATNEISSQIAGMQLATRDSVGAIKQIGTTINRISEIAAAIATSVEQQGGATEEIARNVEQATQGTTEVASNIVDVNKGARETGSASAKVLSSAQSLSGESNRLKLQVANFLNTVRAA